MFDEIFSRRNVLPDTPPPKKNNNKKTMIHNLLFILTSVLRPP